MKLWNGAQFYGNFVDCHWLCEGTIQFPGKVRWGIIGLSQVYSGGAIICDSLILQSHEIPEPAYSFQEWNGISAEDQSAWSGAFHTIDFT